MSDPKRPLLSHLEELLFRARRILIYIVLGFMGGYAVSERLVSELEAPILARLPEGAKLIFTTPFEKFWVYMRVSFIAGVVLALPLVVYEIVAFVTPGLRGRERRRMLSLLVVFSIVFFTGCYLGYRFVLPPLIQAVLNFGSASIAPFLTLSSYINTTLGVLLFTALFMEMPVIMIFASLWGWVDAGAWAKGRRLAIVGNATLAAILSPPDPMSMMVMLLPLQLLYEGGILGARVAQWTSHGRAQNTSQTLS